MYTARGTLDRSAAVERYAPMVRRLASQLIARLPANVEIDDLIQAGMIGLMDALSLYETGHGAQFETFAMQRIRGAMIDELRGADWLPRSVPRASRGAPSIRASCRPTTPRTGCRPAAAPRRACARRASTGRSA